MDRSKILLSLIDLIEKIFHSSDMEDIQSQDIVDRAIDDLRYGCAHIVEDAPSEPGIIINIFGGNENE